MEEADNQEKATTSKQLQPSQQPQVDEVVGIMKVKQFMSILEQLPRLCSPTICGTLSQPTTRSERMSCGAADIFEWSIEQKAILSPANITTDMEAGGEWQNLADFNPAWRQQESETFFSQRTIAPSPMITTTPSARSYARSSRPAILKLANPIYNEEEEDEEFGDEEDDADLNHDQSNPFGRRNAANKKQNLDDQFEDDDDERKLLDDDDDDEPLRTDPYQFMRGNRFNVDDDDYENDNDHNDDNRQHGQEEETEDEHMDDLCFSPQPLRGSQTQQKMDLFSPDTFVRVMEDENTLQSTPKTIGAQRNRFLERHEMYD